MTVDLAGLTHVGLKRSENQDEVFAQLLVEGDQPIACLAVADGMGGHVKGREASQLAIKTVRSELEGWLKSEGAIPTKEWCINLEKEAHRAVSRISCGTEVAGTTLTVAIVHRDQCLIGHVGDSRAYCFRDGKLEQLTEDQTWDVYAEKNGIPNEYGKSLRQAIGVGGGITPDTYCVDMLRSDWLLVCSDGLYKMVGIEALEIELGQSISAKDACERLIQLALDGGGKDNVGVCVARFGVPVAKTRKLDPPLVIAMVAAIILTILVVLNLVGMI